MIPIERKFKEIRRILVNIDVSVGKVEMDVSQLFEPPMPEPEFQIIDGLINTETKSSIFHLLDCFQLVREEIESNLLMQIELNDKKSYLHEILDFYSELEGRIIEDEHGSLSTDIVKFIDTPLEEMMDFHKEQYAAFLRSFKEDLRMEILYITKQINQVKMKKNNLSSTNQKSKPDIIWKRDKTDLIELVKALCLIGAIDNSTCNLTEKKAYQVFGNLLQCEIKKASDLIKYKSKYQKKEYFLEELHSVFQRHLSTIRDKD
jgi:hypothetical protein